MKTVTSINTTAVRRKQDRSASGWSAALILSTFGSCLLLFSGISLSILTATGLISASQWRAFITVALLFGFFALLFAAAHSMDRLAAKDWAERIERSRRTGLTGETFKAD